MNGLTPATAWAAAYYAPNPDHYIVGHTLNRTRSEVWDQMLKIWFLHVTQPATVNVLGLQKREFTRDFYYPHNQTEKVRSITRGAAIRRLRRRGLRVIRVKVVVA